MSYRTFKRLMGETSLERKCRFLFGGGLLILITGSFSVYGRLTSGLVDEQNRIAGRLMVMPIILRKHWEWSEDRKLEPEFVHMIEAMSKELPPRNLEDYKWDLLKSTPGDPQKSPSNQADFDALDELAKGKAEWSRTVVNAEGKREFQYYGAVRATASCVTCHLEQGQQISEGDLIGMAKVTLPMAPTEKALAWNNAILLATAIITAFLAMAAAFKITQYVIVKPVLHLKEVSDAISRGNLDRRADIRTGDEFEELSQAYNRMLRHLVAVQEELRQVNTTLDGKVDELAR